MEPSHVLDSDGLSICTKCYRAPKRICAGCGKRERSYRLAENGHLCRKCGAAAVACAYCGVANRRIEASLPDGPCCYACYRKAWAKPGICVLCEERHAIVTSLGFCWKCVGATVRGKVCHGCGFEGLLLKAGQCERCALKKLALDYFAKPDGSMTSQIRLVYDVLVSTVEPRNAIGWLNESPAAKKIKSIIEDGRDLTYEDFISPTYDRTLTFARDLFLSCGAVTKQVGDVAELQAWLERTCVERLRSASSKALIKQFAHWSVFKDFRRLTKSGTSEEYSSKFARSTLLGAIDLVVWIEARNLTLATCTQVELDVFFARSVTMERAIKYVRWLGRRGAMPKLKTPVREKPKRVAADEESRLETIARLLTDESLPLQVRVSGLLVGLYGQMMGRLRQLKKNHIVVDRESGEVSIADGRSEPLPLEQCIGDLLLQLCQGQPIHGGIASGTESDWVFEGHRPGRAVTESGIARQFSQAGIDMRELRGAALVDLAREMELQLVSKTLDLCDETAYSWWARGGNEYRSYAATRGDYLGHGT